MGEIFKARRPLEQLRFTGERLNFDSRGQAVYEHLHRYFFAREFCRGRDVLDVASREGFGSAYLAQVARSVVGVDISKEAVRHARASYAGENLQFRAGDATRLEFADASFDVVVSFETIEHIDDQDRYMREVRRVLRPGGILLVSTPNRDVYSPANGPVNPFHVRELTREEFLKVVRSQFPRLTLYGQRPVTGVALVVEPEDGDAGGAAPLATFEKRDENHYEYSRGLARPLHFIAVAPLADEPARFHSVYIETGDVDASIRLASEVRELRELLNARNGAAEGGEATAAADEKELTRRLKAERNQAVSAVAGLKLQVADLTQERAHLANEAAKAYRRPWRPIKYALFHAYLKLVAATAEPFSAKVARRWRRSADKRSPSRFDRFLEPYEPDGQALPVSNAQELPVVVETEDRTITVEDIENLRLPTSDDAPRVSVIIPSYGKASLTLQCLRSIADNPPSIPVEIIVVDDASQDPGVEILAKAPGLRVEVNPKNLGFLRSCNRAAGLARGEFIFFLNNDTIVLDRWLEPLLEVFDRFPEAGFVGSKLLNSDGSLQEAGGIVWNDGVAWNYGRSDNPDRPQYNYVRETDYISGCAILIPRQLWTELGGFDERYVPAYCEETDLAFRVRAANKKVYYCPFSVVVHLDGATMGTDVRVGLKAYQRANTEKLRERWRDTLQRDQAPPGLDIMQARDRSRHRRTALVVDHYVPQPDQDAGSRTIMAMIEALQAADYVVKFWPDNLHFDPEYTPVLQRMGVEVLYGRMSFEQWIVENGDAISLALLSRPTVAPRYIDLLRAETIAKIVYYGHDLHFLRMRMEAEQRNDASLATEAAAMERVERTIFKQADVVLYPSPEEAAVARPEARQAASINAYVYDEFAGPRTPPKDAEILFVAGFAHAPNVDAAVWLVQDILPLIRERVPGATLALVGANPTEEVRSLESEGVRVTGRVSEEELRAAYARVRVAIVPLRFGAGVKSKVAEALREGLPLVTTSVGGQGLPDIEQIVSIAEDPRGVADAAIKLLEDDELWRKMSARQVDYARKLFSREAFRQAFLGSFEEDFAHAQQR